MISEVRVQGDEVIYEEVKVRREGDGTREQPQQPQRQHQPRLQQHLLQDQVGPLSSCDDRPGEQQRQQQRSQEGSVSAGGYNPGNQQPEQDGGGG